MHGVASLNASKPKKAANQKQNPKSNNSRLKEWGGGKGQALLVYYMLASLGSNHVTCVKQVLVFTPLEKNEVLDV